MGELGFQRDEINAKFCKNFCTHIERYLLAFKLVFLPLLWDLPAMTSIHTRHIRAHTHFCSHMHAHTHACTHTHRHTHSLFHTHTHTHTCAHIHTQGPARHCSNPGDHYPYRHCQLQDWHALHHQDRRRGRGTLHLGSLLA